MHLFDQSIQASDAREGNDGKRIHPVEIADGFSINGLPNGGYLMALLARQMLDRTDKHATPIITVNFLTRSIIGPGEIVTREISRSKQFSRYEAILVQNGKEILKAMGTFVADDLECVLDRYEESVPVIAPLEECMTFPEMPGFTIYDNMEVRMELDSAPWLRGETGKKSEHRGWIRFRDDRKFDVCGILLASDAFPPPIFATQGPASWVPTIEMSVNIRNLPAGQWLKGRFRTRHITCGLLEEDGELWDEENQLVAISRQIAQFRR